MMIVHLTTKADWKMAQEMGEYRSESLNTEGFIHCSTPEQIIGVANNFYQRVPDLLLLWVDPDQLIADVRWESPVHPSSKRDEPQPEIPPDSNADLFPHIYGAINLKAVIQVVDFLPDADGLFRHTPLRHSSTE